MNIAAFAWDGISNARFALFPKEDVANTKKAEKLICWTSKDEDGHEVPIGVTNLAEEETSLIDLLIYFIFQFVPKTIIKNFVEISM